MPAADLSYYTQTLMKLKKLVKEAAETAIKRQADMGVDEFIMRPCAENLDQMDLLAEVAARLS